MRTGRRILLAEDDPRDLELTLLAMERRGLAGVVDVVHDGEAVLDYLYRRGSHASRLDVLPAVVLLDLQMPKLSGQEVIQRIKADPTLRSVPVVAFTSSRHERDLQACYAAGVNAYVVKPLDFKEFMAAAELLGAFWLQSNITVGRLA
jgi:CheY-like chemotaxis protein